MTGEDTAPEADEQPDTRPWDQFWTEVNGKRCTETIRGVEVPVPVDLPLAFEQRSEELRDSAREEDVRELVAMLFGPGVLEKWVAAGMGLREFQTILTWGMAHGGGRPVTFAEAYEIASKGDGAGKALNRAARRAAQTAQSAGTGGASRPTSRASTASARKKSRR